MINSLLKRATLLKTFSNPIFYRRLSGVIRKLAITLPCFLICGAVAFADERAKLFDSGSVGKQVVFDEITNRWTVVSTAMVLSEIDLGESGGEGSAKFSDSIFPRVKVGYSYRGKVTSRPSQSRSYEAANDLWCYTGDVAHG